MMGTLTVAILQLLVSTSFATENECKKTVLLEEADWQYKPVNTDEWHAHRSGFQLSSQLPKNVPCCTGTLRLRLNTQHLEALKKCSSPAMLLPEIAGAKLVRLHDRAIPLPSGDYSSERILLPLSKEDLKNSFYIEIEIQSGPGNFTGAWMGKALIGDSMSLNKLLYLWRLHQQSIPLILSIVFFAIIAVVSPALLFSNTYRSLFLPFLFGIGGWVIFFLFLSGSVRSTFPEIGTILHFPFRLLAAGGQFYLMASLAQISPNKVRQIILLYIVVFILQIFETQFGQFQTVTYGLLNFTNIYALFYLFPKEKNAAAVALFIFALVAEIGHLSDSLKLILNAWEVEYPVIFLSRYCTPPILFYAVVFVSHALLTETERVELLEAKRLLYKRVSHDLQSPVAALRYLAPTLEGEEKELVQHIVKRVAGIIDSLRESERTTLSRIPLKKVLEFSREEKLLESKNKGHQAQITIAPDIGEDLYVIGNSSDFLRSVSNILNNAIEAAERESATIHISAVTKGSHSVELNFSDKGKMLTNEVLEKLGDAGFTSGKQNGQGLGLNFAKECVTSWGGKISFKRNQPQGLVVTATLRLANNT